MKSKDLLFESYSALASNRARSALTMLGIIIGIASVIALVAIGQGAQSSIQDKIESIGSNLLTVSPGAARGPGTTVSAGRGSATSLTLDDEAALASQLTSVTAVDPEVSKRFQVTAKGTNTNTQVLGTTPEYASTRNVTMDLGTFITAQQVQSGAKVAVLGPTTRDDLFGEGNTSVIGQEIKINNAQFHVIGVTASKGSTGFVNQDDMIVVPISTAQQYLTGGKTITGISIEAAGATDMDSVQQQVTAILLQRHNIADPTQADFTVTNQADIISAASSVTGTFTILLASIAGISLVVGGIGIMNMMLTTVTERTREIGLRKAIGATAKDINIQFLTEAIMLTFLGGAIGIVLGWIVSALGSHFAGLTTKISLSSILLAFGVSAGIGVIFGYYPARRASKLNPIEALRFE